MLNSNKFILYNIRIYKLINKQNNNNNNNNKIKLIKK